MFQTLKDAGLWEDTYVLWLSDNGAMPYWAAPVAAEISYGCNMPLRGGKSTYMEGGVKSYGFISGPLLAKNHPELVNTAFDGLSHVMDMAPTIVEGLAGLQATTAQQDGANLWPALTGEAKWTRSFQYLSAQTVNPFTGASTPYGGLIDWPYKFMIGAPQFDGYYPCDTSPAEDVKYDNSDWLLFNLEEDPLEAHDLSEQYPELVQQYITVLLDLFDNSTLYRPMQDSTYLPAADPSLHNNTWAPFLPANPDDGAFVLKHRRQTGNTGDKGRVEV